MWTLARPVAGGAHLLAEIFNGLFHAALELPVGFFQRRNSCHDCHVRLPRKKELTIINKR